MRHVDETTGTFPGGRNTDIFFRSLTAADEKARLVIVHGLGEHSGRYSNVWGRLLPVGVSIWALDLRGHGRSHGERGHVEHFDRYAEDLDKLVDLAAEKAPPRAGVFLMGHSLGGLIALNYALRFPHKLRGLVVSSPVLQFKVKVPAYKILLGRLMSSVWPRLGMANELDATKLSHDRSVVDAYINDPLVHNRVSARWFTEFVSAMARTRLAAPVLRVPILMQLAGDDALVDADASQTFFDHLTLTDKTIRVYGGLFHEIYNETDSSRQAVLDDLQAWIHAHQE